MKKFIIQTIRAFGGLHIVRFLNSIIRGISSFTHHMQFVLEWSYKPIPDWFDHRLDQFHLWNKTRNPSSWERGIFNLLVMRPGAKVLELCCGDGFNTHHFYSIRAGHVTSLDIDPRAIQFAKNNSKAPNVSFLIADIRKDIPDEKFDNIIWDASLEYFTQTEIENLMNTLKSRLSPNGILSGFSIIQNSLKEYHKYAFRSKEDLLQFLNPYFKNVQIIETQYPTRHNLYFFASDNKIPEIIV